MYKFDKKDVFCIANAEDAKKYIGHGCYFGNSIERIRLSIKQGKIQILEKVHCGENVCTGEVFRVSGLGYYIYGLCLPCELVERVEPKYRAFNSREEFEKTLNIKLGDVVEFMERTIRRTALYAGNALGTRGTQYVTLGGYVYQFKDLFRDCKLILDGKEVPFGVLDEE